MSQFVTNALLSSPRKISLLLSDVDGTLVTKEKILTDRARAAEEGFANGIERFI